ncbi:MAG: roadblock/LC7 domain-containing protein [Candidatus Ranarchaeia archaeon]|jgi:predicted regulator of Ras-like GTPase activity (Roadblock/LC7/MglB family)
MNRVLAKAIQQGISAITVSNFEGLVVASKIQETVDKNITAAMSGLAFSTANQVKEELKLGLFKDITIRGDKGSIFIRRVGTLKDPFLITALLRPPKRYFKRIINGVCKELMDCLDSL